MNKEELILYAKKLQWAYAGVMGGTQLWLWIRTFLDLLSSGSKIGDACGVGYSSRQQYWRERTGIVKRKSFAPYVLEMMNHGNRWEDTALHLFLTIHLPNYKGKVLRTGIVLSPIDSRTGATPDALLPELNAIVEIKCRWPNLEKCPESEGIHTYSTPYIPASHHMQMLHEMHCTGTTKGYYVCLGLTAETARNPNNWNKQTPFRLVVEEYKFPERFYNVIVWPKIQKFMKCVEKKIDPGRLSNGSGKAMKGLLLTHMQPIGGTRYYGGYTKLIREPVGTKFT